MMRRDFPTVHCLNNEILTCPTCENSELGNNLWEGLDVPGVDFGQDFQDVEMISIGPGRSVPNLTETMESNEAHSVGQSSTEAVRMELETKWLTLLSRF